MTVCGEKATGVCVAAKCSHFKRCCPVVWDKYGKIKPQTNEEWFCGLSTERKAHFFAERFGGSADRYNNIYDTMLEWLKQPHTTEVGK